MPPNDLNRVAAFDETLPMIPPEWIAPILYALIGAAIASLLWLAAWPLIAGRITAHTREQLIRKLPMSLQEIEAEQDRLRAEFALKLARKDQEIARLGELLARARTKVEPKEGQTSMDPRA